MSFSRVKKSLFSSTFALEKKANKMKDLLLKLKTHFLLLIVLVLLLPACNTRSKTERMQSVVAEVRAKYKAYEDISQDDQIFEAYDFFVKQKDMEMPRPLPSIAAVCAKPKRNTSRR